MRIAMLMVQKMKKIGNKDSFMKNECIKKNFYVLNALILSVLILFVSAGQASIAVQASVDRNAMDPGDTFELRVEVSSSGDETPSIDGAPDIGGFELVNQGMSSSARAGVVTGANGAPEYQRSNQTTYSYFYQALKIGKYKIDPIEVKVGAKVFRTASITLTVERGASGSRSRTAKDKNGRRRMPKQMNPADPWQGDEQQDVEDLFSQLLKRHGLMPNPNGGFRTQPFDPQDAFFIQVEVDKADVFAGEQVTAAWYLYTKGIIRDLDTLKYPNLKSFWKEDIEISTNLNFTQEIINGVPYRKALLASYALFPIKEGEALIDTYKAKCSVMADMFGFGSGKAYVYTKVSKEVKINVRPVPSVGRPSDYSGAVGDFRVTTKIDDYTIATNQPFSFHIRFEGKGNAKLIDLPPFETPPGIELYDTQKEAKFFKNGTSYKDFTLQLIPRNQGEFVIPSVSVSIFDPTTKTYVTKKTEPIKIQVGLGTQDPNIKNSPLLLSQADRAEVARKEFKPILETVWHPATQKKRNLEIVIFIFILLSGIILLLLKARSELGWGEKKRDLLKQMQWRFKRIKSRLSKISAREAAVETTNAVYFILGQLSDEGGATQEIEKLVLLIPPSVRAEFGSELHKSIDRLQMLSFAPDSVIGNLKEPAQVKKLISDIEEVLEKAVILSVGNSSLNIAVQKTI